MEEVKPDEKGKTGTKRTTTKKNTTKVPKKEPTIKKTTKVDSKELNIAKKSKATEKENLNTKQKNTRTRVTKKTEKPVDENEKRQITKTTKSTEKSTKTEKKDRLINSNKSVQSTKLEKKVQTNKIKKRVAANEDEVNNRKKTATKSIKKENTKFKEELEDFEQDDSIEEIVIQQEDVMINIDEIKDELQKHNQISGTDKKQINKNIVPNIGIALAITLYYVFMLLGFKNIESINYVVDLKVFAGAFLAIAIVLFEKAYRQDKRSLTIYGVEMLIFSILNFVLVYVYYKMNMKYETIVFGLAIFANIYYTIKSIVVYIKKKKEYFFEKSDITEIISK